MERKLRKRQNRTFWTHIVTLSTRKCRPPDGAHFAQSRHVDNNGNVPFLECPPLDPEKRCATNGEFLKVTNTLTSTPESLLISQIGARRPPSTPSVYERTCFGNAHFATLRKLCVGMPSGDGAKDPRHANTKWANSPRKRGPSWRLRGTHSPVGVPTRAPDLTTSWHPAGPTDGVSARRDLEREGTRVARIVAIP